MNPYEAVKAFEAAVADYAGSRFAVAVDSCTNAIFLCCKYLNVDRVTIPNRTYPSVPCSVIHAGGSVAFKDVDWRELGYYRLEPYEVYDAAQAFYRGMFHDMGGFVCVSFTNPKPVKIGKGGMILTDDGAAVEWFKRARYCGRNETALIDDQLEMLGWNMYMTPEQAVRGLSLMSVISDKNTINVPEYPDLSRIGIYENHNLRNQ